MSSAGAKYFVPHEAIIAMCSSPLAAGASTVGIGLVPLSFGSAVPVPPFRFRRLGSAGFGSAGLGSAAFRFRCVWVPPRLGSAAFRFRRSRFRRLGSAGLGSAAPVPPYRLPCFCSAVLVSAVVAPACLFMLSFASTTLIHNIIHLRHHRIRLSSDTLTLSSTPLTLSPTPIHLSSYIHSPK